MKTNMIRRLLFLLCILTSSNALAQKQAKIDSLQQVLKTKLTPKKKVDVYNLLAGEFLADSSKVAYYTSKAITLAEEVDYMEGKVDALYWQGKGMLAKRHFSQAATLYNHSLQIAKKNKYLRGVAKACSGITKMSWMQGNYTRALKFGKRSLKINQEIKDKAEVASNLHNLGIIYDLQGNSVKAIEFYQLALDIYKQIKDQKRVANIYNSIGLIYQVQNNYSNALKVYNNSLKIGRQLKNKRIISITKANLGNIYNQQGKYTEALNAYQESLKIDEQAGKKIPTIGSHINIGNIYKSQGRYHQALTTFQKAIKIGQEIGPTGKRMIVICYHHIGNIYQLQGNYSQAVKAYQTSLKISKQINNKSLQALNYDRIGTNYRLQNNYPQSIAAYQNALKIRRLNKNRGGIAQTYLNLGKLALVQKHSRQAQDYFKKALAMRKEMGEKSLSADAHINLGIAYYTEKQYATAQSYLEKGVQMGQAIGDPHIVRDGAEYLSKVYEAMGKPQKALETHILFKQMADSLLNTQNIRQLARLETQFVAQKREDSLQLLQNQKETAYQADIQQRKFSQRLTLLGLGLSAVLVAVLAFFYRSKQRSNRKLGTLNENLESSYQEIKTVNEQLQELTEFKSRMTHLIIHDLKNPLAGIIGLASSESEGALDKTKISSIAQQMLYMTQNILDVQKNEEAALTLQLRPLAVAPIIQQVMTQQQILASAKNIRLSVVAIPNDQIQADEDILVRILTNLLSNAIKFTPENGAVKLETSYVENDSMLRVSITDTGIGIPANQLRKVFDKFHSADQNQKGNFRSTGLGLTFCKLAVEQQGGTIGVESEEDQGSTFCFTLPLVAKATESTRDMLIVHENNPVLAEVARVKAQLQGSDQALVKAVVAEIRKQGLNHTHPTRLARVFDMVKTKVEVSSTVATWMQMLLREATNEAIFEALVTIE